jgi:hypothetical protein
MPVLNSYITYIMKVGKAMTDYLQAEAGEMTEKLKARRPAKSGRPSNGDNPLPFITWYFSSPVLQTVAKGSTTQRQCHICNKTAKRESSRVMTRFWCTECEETLCIPLLNEKLRRKPGDRLPEDKYIFITVFVLDFVQNPSCSFLLH